MEFRCGDEKRALLLPRRSLLVRYKGLYDA
jgi:hypothetical protein